MVPLGSVASLLNIYYGLLQKNAVFLRNIYYALP